MVDIDRGTGTTVGTDSYVSTFSEILWDDNYEYYNENYCNTILNRVQETFFYGLTEMNERDIPIILRQYTGWVVEEHTRLITQKTKLWMWVINGLEPELLFSLRRFGPVTMRLPLNETTMITFIKDNTIRITSNNTNIRITIKTEKLLRDWVDIIYQAIKHTRWLKQLHIISILSKSERAKVFMCHEESNTTLSVLKIVRGSLRTLPEASIIQKLSEYVNHPRVVEYKRMFEDENYVYIFMSFTTGHRLSELITNQHQLLTEHAVAKLLYQIVDALAWIHHLNIVHGNMNLDNIMVENISLIETDANVRIIDFSSAIDLEWEGNAFSNHKRRIGKPGYISPERLHGGIPSTGMDMYSCGIILYQLLSKKCIKSNYNTLVHEMDIRCLLNELKQSDISYDAQDLLRQLLKPNPIDRITAVQAQTHSWFTNQLFSSSGGGDDEITCP